MIWGLDYAIEELLVFDGDGWFYLKEGWTPKNQQYMGVGGTEQYSDGDGSMITGDWISEICDWR